MPSSPEYRQGRGHPLPSDFELSKTRWFVFLATGFRVLGLGAAFLDYLSLGANVRRTNMEILAIVAIGWSIALTGLLLTRRFVQLVYSRPFAILDLTLVLGVLLLEARFVAAHQLFVSVEDIVSVTLVGATVLWTFIYGLRVGIALAVAYVPLQILMGHINGYAIGSIDWAQLFARTGWLCLGVFAGKGVQMVNRFVEQLVGEQAERSGRILALQQMHDRALQELSVIIMETDPSDNAVERLASVGNRARRLNNYLRSWFEPDGLAMNEGFHAELREIVSECESSSQIAFSLVALHDEHDGLQTHHAALVIEAVRAACWNIVVHSGATTATVNCSERHGDLVVTVYDDGCGFDPNQCLDGVHLGVSTIQSAVEQTGGFAHLETSLDSGTKWTLSCPLQSEVSVRDCS